MDMIAMLAGLGGPFDNIDPTATYSGDSTGGKTGGGYTDSRSFTNYTRGASEVTGTLDQYLASKNLLADLPALPKPAAVTAAAPYGPKMLSEAAFLESIGAAGGKIPTPQEMINQSWLAVRNWIAEASTDAGIAERRKALLSALLLGTPARIVSSPTIIDRWVVQMANRAIVEEAQKGDWFKRAVNDLQAEQNNRFGKRTDMKGAARLVFDTAKNDDQAWEILRNLAAGREASGPILYPKESATAIFRVPAGGYPSITATTTASASDRGSSRGLFGLGAVDYVGGWPALLNAINSDIAAAIIGASRRFSNTAAASSEGALWTAYSNFPAFAIAEGLIIAKYADLANKISAWRSARDQYVVAKRRYDIDLNRWASREKYRNNRIKAIESYSSAVVKQYEDKAAKDKTKSARDMFSRVKAESDRVKNELRLKKEAEDAKAAKDAAEQAARDLQTKIDELNLQIQNSGTATATGDTAAAAEAKAAIAALTATIEQLKQDLVNAQNAAAEAARNANQTATSGGGDTTGAAADATQSAADATQTAADALAQTGETVTFKTESKGMGVGTLLVVGAVAAGGWWLWKRRQLRQIGP